MMQCKTYLSLLCAGLLVSAGSAVPAHATTYLYNGLVDDGTVATGANGFGNNPTSLSFSSNVSPESGCIAPGLIAGSSACGGEYTLNDVAPYATLVTGGARTTRSLLRSRLRRRWGGLGITSANQVGVLFNGGTPSSAPEDITDLSIKLYNSSGTLVLDISDAFNNVNTYPGQGNAGTLFTIAPADYAVFNALIASGDSLALDGAVDYCSPDVNDSSTCKGGGGSAENFTIANIGAPAATPEPSSLFLLGSGILGAAGLLRRRVAAHRG